MGKKDKNIFCYLGGGYHGETLGALSMGSLGIYKEIYSPLLIKSIELPGPDCYRCPYNLSKTNCNAECFERCVKELNQNKDRISGVIIEPILQAANGMNIYSPNFLKKLREYTEKNQIHLICDEIAAGFGRTGKMMASHHSDIVPDFVTVSKGLTGGFLALSAVLTSEDVYLAFYAPYNEQKAFLHSHSYTGNPIACAAGCAVFDIFEGDDILRTINEKGKQIYNKVLDLQDNNNVGDIRTIGMVCAIELVKDKKNKTSFDWKERIGYKIYREAERKGVLLRNLGDIIYFMPPYIINDKEIDFMTGVAKRSIDEILKKL